MRIRVLGKALGLATALGLLALVGPGAALAQPQDRPRGGGLEERGQAMPKQQHAPRKQGPLGAFDEPYFWGSYDEAAANARDDWFYDSYSYDLSARDWTDIPWYGEPELYSGLFNDNRTDNDWFFDAYAPPSSSDPFQR
jgi:hypothetical protein